MLKPASAGFLLPVIGGHMAKLFDILGLDSQEPQDQVAAPRGRLFDMLGIQDVEPVAPEQAEQRDSGFIDTLASGAKSTLRAIGATGDLHQRDREGLTQAGNEAAQSQLTQDADLAAIKADIQRRKEAIGQDAGWLESGAELAKAAWNNPKGAGLFLAEQMPNSAAAMGAGYAGFKAGGLAGGAVGTAVAPGPGTAIGATIGAVTGGVLGMFGANYALEGGNKAIEAAQQGRMSEDDLSNVEREGMIKAGVITGVDAVTMGIGGKIMGTAQRAVDRAGAKVLTSAGVDVTDRAAIAAAVKANPALVQAVQAAEKGAFDIATTLGQRAIRGGAGISLETLGEGIGEYYGEGLASGNWDKMEAMMEAFSSLGQSAGETAFVAAQNKVDPVSGILSASDVEGAIQASQDAVNYPVAAELDTTGDQTIADITGQYNDLLAVQRQQNPEIQALAADAAQDELAPAMAQPARVEFINDQAIERTDVTAPSITPPPYQRGTGGLINTSSLPIVGQPAAAPLTQPIAGAPSAYEQAVADKDAGKLLTAAQVDLLKNPPPEVATPSLITTDAPLAAGNGQAAIEAKRAEQAAMTKAAPVLERDMAQDDLAPAPVTTAGSPVAGNAFSPAQSPTQQTLAEQENRPATNIKVAGTNADLLSNEQLQSIIQDPTTKAQTRRAAQEALGARYTTPRADEQIFPDIEEGTADGAQAPQAQQASTQEPQAPATPARTVTKRSAAIEGLLLENPAEARDIQAEEVDVETLGSEVSSVGSGTMGKIKAKALRQLMGMFGRKIVYFRASKKTAGGIYKSGKTIYVNVDAIEDPLAVVNHEFSHTLESEHGDDYKVALKAAVELLTAAPEKATKYAKYYDRADWMQDGKVKAENLNDLARELIGDLTGNSGRDGSFWSEVFDEINRTHRPAEARSIITRLRDAIVAFIDKLIKATPKSGFDLEGQGFNRDDLQAIRKMVIDMAAKSFVNAERARIGLPVKSDMQGDEVTRFAGKRDESVHDHRMKVERQARKVAAEVTLSDDEEAAIIKSASATGLPLHDIRTKVIEIKKQFPTDGIGEERWAPIEFQKVDMPTFNKKQSPDNPFPSDAVFFKQITYNFHTSGDVTETERINQTADALANEIKSYHKLFKKNKPIGLLVIRQRDWYRSLHGKLRSSFGGFGDFLAQLLGPTSANTPVGPNWAMGIEALQKATSGEWDGIIESTIAWRDGMLTAAESLSEYEATLSPETKKQLKNVLERVQAKFGKGKHPDKAGYTMELVAAIDPRLAELRMALEDSTIYKGEIPRKSNGTQFGMATDGILRILHDGWSDKKPGDAPKTKNYYQNIVGRTWRATIDVWAARTLRRLTDNLYGDRPRIPTVAETGVQGNVLADGVLSGSEFGFGQEVFEIAAETLRNSGIKEFKDTTAADVQAMIWFGEKEKWAREDWTSKIGEEGSIEQQLLMAGHPDRERIRKLTVAARKGAPNIETKPYSVGAKKVKFKNKEGKTEYRPETPKEIVARHKADVAAWKIATKQAHDELESLQRTPDYWTAGVTTELDSSPLGRAPGYELARASREIEDAALSQPGVMAIKAQSSEGVFGKTYENAIDFEMVTANDYNPIPLVIKLITKAKETGQMAAFLSRRVRDDEAINPMYHRPGVEIYFRKEIPKHRETQIIKLINSMGFDGMTFQVDPIRTPDALSGKTGAKTGLRLQWVPEFDGSIQEDADVGALLSAWVAKSREMSKLVERLKKENDVALAQRNYYETSVYDWSGYDQELANLRGGQSVQQEADAGNGTVVGNRGQWRGQPISGSYTIANRVFGNDSSRDDVRSGLMERRAQEAGLTGYEGRTGEARFSGPRSYAASHRFDGRDAEAGLRGSLQPEGVSATGIHFSKQERPTLSSAAFGQGMRGAEWDRLSTAEDARIKQRIYFYINSGKGITPESDVGAHAHVLGLKNLYDYDNDPRDLRLRRTANEFESAVLDNEFDGYISNSRGVAILLGERVETPTYIGIGSPQNVPLSGKAEKSAYGKLQQAIAANKSLPNGQMKGADWKRLMAALMPDMDVSHLDDEASYYKDQLVKKPKVGADNTAFSPFRAVDTSDGSGKVVEISTDAMRKDRAMRELEAAHDGEMFDDKYSFLTWKSPADVIRSFNNLKAEELRSGMLGKDEFSSFFDEELTPDQIRQNATDRANRHYSDAMRQKWVTDWVRDVLANPDIAGESRVAAAQEFSSTNPDIRYSAIRATKELKQYADEHPNDFFRSMKASSKSIKELAMAIARGIPLREVDPKTNISNETSLDFTAATKDPKLDNLWEMTFAGTDASGKQFDRKAYIAKKNDAVWVNVGGLEPGDDGGKVYMVAGAFAHNNKLKLVGDPDGITEAGKRRRLENMIALALKYGTTEFMKPHDDMIGWNGLKWFPKGGDNNLTFMLMTSNNVVTKLAPEIRDVTFNFNTGNFERGGEPLSRNDFDGMAVRLRKDLGTDAEGAPGSGTLRQNSLWRSLVSRGDQERGLAALPGDSEGRGEAVRSSLEGVKYSLPRNALPNETTGDRAIDGSELTELRRAAARLERPKDGVFLRVTEDGRAIATGPKGTKVPDTFRRFAKDSDLVFTAGRIVPQYKDTPTSMMDPGVTKKSEPMPIIYRESGALYFGEMGTTVDRTEMTRFSLPRKLSDDLERQQVFLTEAANDAGYKNIDEFAAGNLDEFLKAAEQWRVSHPEEALFTTNRIVGNSGRQYTPEQQAMFKHTGRDIDEKNALERLKDYVTKRWVQGIFDQFSPIKDISKQAYTLMRLSRGASGAFEAFLKHGKLSIKDGTYDGDTSGGALDEVFVPLGKETTDFLNWIAGHRAERLAMEGKERLFSPADIAAAKSLANGTTDFDYTLRNGQVTRDRSKIYADSLIKFNEFNKNVMDMAEQSGLIDGAARKLWESEFYVPFYRVMEDDNIRAMGIKKGVVRQQAFKKLKGGEEKLGDLLQNTLLNWHHLIDASAKNRAAKAAIEAAEKAGIAKLVGATMGRYATSNGMMLPPGTKGTVWFMEGGYPEVYMIDDPAVMEAINGLQYAGLNGPLWSILTAPKHWLTMGVTASPFFKVRNLIRDSMQAIATSDLSYNIAGNVMEGYRLTNRDRQEYVSALAGGGLIRFGTMLEGNEANRTRQLIRKGAKDANMLDDQSAWGKFYTRMLEPSIEAYNELGNRGEEINRMSLYNQLIKQGKDHAEASLMARDLMDFSSQGSFETIRILSQIVPFFNARMQGMYKLGRASKENRAHMATVIFTAALASLALMALAAGDEDKWKKWKKREEWDKASNWWFEFGGVSFRIPKPFELGTVSHIAERTVEGMFDSERDAGKRTAKALMDAAMNQLSMNPVPQAFKPIIDLYANIDSFSKRPIEGMAMQRLDPKERYNASTSMPARWLSNATGGALSPLQYDHLVRSYFGWIGATSVGTADLIARGVNDEPTRPALDYFKFASGGIVREDETGSRYVSMMYDQFAELEQAHATYNRMRKEGKLEEAAEYKEDNADKLKAYRSVANVKKQVAAVTDRIRMIERSNLHPAEKRVKLRTLRQQQSDLAAKLSQ
jgi:hypothetical protein